MGLIDMVNLLHDKTNTNTDDLSVMLNFERIQNGASKQWLLKV